MNKPHKHSELIKAWADGAEIQIFIDGEWEDTITDRIGFNWYEDCKYRIKPEPKPDVPEGLIDPKSYYQGFEDGKNSVLKPEPKPDVVCFSDVRYEKDYEEIEWQENETEYMSNLRLTFDGETGELKSAEVLK